MCDVVVPLPMCVDCVDAERRVLAEKLRTTPAHPLIEDRLAQLAEDATLTAESLDALRAAYMAALEAGEDTRALITEESARYRKRQSRELQARSYLRALAFTDDFARYPLDEVLSEWAAHPDPVVRRRLAANPLTPVAVLEVLARDYDRDVLGVVMQNPNHSWGCFFRVAANPHSAGGLAEILCLMSAATLPPSAKERVDSDAALAELTVDERFSLVRFLGAT